MEEEEMIGKEARGTLGRGYHSLWSMLSNLH